MSANRRESQGEASQCGRYCTRVSYLVPVLGVILILCTEAFGSWQQVTSVPQWSPSYGRTVAQLNGRIWLLDDRSGLWSSTDGTQWDLASSAPQPHSFGQLLALDGRLWIVGGGSYTDVWSSPDGVNWTQVAFTAPWPSNVLPFVFEEKIWVLSQQSGAVWSSPDGTSWTQATASAPWPRRSEGAVAVHNGKMWLLGGAFGEPDDEVYLGDVWTSSDGATWTQVTAHAAWTGVTNHGCISFAGRLWVIGDLRNPPHLWSSIDGEIWDSSVESPPWVFASSPGLVVFGGRLWLVGGQWDPHYIETREVWSTPDGLTWTAATEAAPWGGRAYGAAAVFDGKMWVLGGRPSQGDMSTDAWWTTDGHAWTRSTSDAPWGKRASLGAAGFAGNLWVLGGWRWDQGSGNRLYMRDVWRSVDGVNWTQVASSAPWHGRRDHACIAWQDKLWVLGGRYTVLSGAWYALADVWSSPDGSAWTEVTPGAAWGARSGFGTAVFQDKLWVLGGSLIVDGLDSTLNDVWCSEDGRHWTQVTAAASWTSRAGHGIVVYGGRIWVMGGYQGTESTGANLNDTWYSEDGLTWTEDTVSASWKPRRDFSTFAYDHKIWMMGGDVGDFGFRSDIWTWSTDFHFTELPAGGWKEEGEAVELSVGVEQAEGTVTYEWLKDGVPISGATANTFNIASLTEADAGWYTCRVTDESKAVYETPPVLIEVFAAGSLPVAAAWAIWAALGICIAAGMLRLRRLRP